MSESANNDEKPRLEVYLKRSVLLQFDQPPESFSEGNPSLAAKQRLQLIKSKLDTGFLTDTIDNCRTPRTEEPLEEGHADLFTRLVGSVTSEVGRALVGLTVLQLCVKAISPEQSIRLHKAGGTGKNFSWAEGIPMRVLDKTYITPVLRQYDLLKLNADGFMMTRSLAENYPYSKLYKAALRGARAEWLELVDLIEAGTLKPVPALRHLLALLFNRSDKFKESAENALRVVKKVLSKITSIDDAVRFIRSYVDSSPYSARVFEIALHSLFQVLEDHEVFEGVLKPLAQMRSANKKHGNIGDIEIMKKHGSMEILEAWDAKYGKPYLRDELDEISEKLEDHSAIGKVGFVVDTPPNLKQEIIDRMQEIEDVHEVKLFIQHFDDWVKIQAARASDAEPQALARGWIQAFAESLCQRRRDRAPIDEPADVWVTALTQHASAWK